MTMSALEADEQRPHEQRQGRISLDAWLRRALSDQYGAVAREALPDLLLQLLPEE